jgi:hypothetical protein
MPELSTPTQGTLAVPKEELDKRRQEYKRKREQEKRME